MTNSLILIFATLFGADAPCPILPEAPCPVLNREMVLPQTLAFVSSAERTCYNCQRPITSGVKYWAETPFCSSACIDAIQGYGPPVPPYSGTKEPEAPYSCSCPNCKCDTKESSAPSPKTPADFTVSVEPIDCVNGQCSVISKVLPNGIDVTKTVCTTGTCGPATILGQPTGWMQLPSCTSGNCGAQSVGICANGTCGSQSVRFQDSTFRPRVAARKVAFTPVRFVGRILFGRRK